MHILAYSERGGGETVQHRQRAGQRDGTGVTTVVDVTALLPPQHWQLAHQQEDQDPQAAHDAGDDGGGGVAI